MKEAQFYHSREENKVRCELCPHRCLLDEQEYGICQARQNRNGKLYSLNYQKLTSTSMDPVEKKPLYHFYPGSPVLSLGTWGCNFKCPFCQNWRISQEKPTVRDLSPQKVIELARRKNSFALAYTYSEPLIWYEFVRETAELAAEEGIKNILVTNGYIKQKPLKELLPVIDAANVDLKSSKDSFYRQYCQGSKKPVLETIEMMNEKIHLEITTLVISELNDEPEEMKELFSWLKELNPEIPLHLSRYFPNYELEKPPTSLEKMKDFYQMAIKYLKYVYLGNTGLSGYNNTICSRCEQELITRNRYQVSARIENGHCPACGQEIAGEY